MKYNSYKMERDSGYGGNPSYSDFKIMMWFNEVEQKDQSHWPTLVLHVDFKPLYKFICIILSTIMYCTFGRIQN